MSVVAGRSLPQPKPDQRGDAYRPKIYVVGDDRRTREMLRSMCGASDVEVIEFRSGNEFLQSYRDDGESPRCLVLTVCLPDVSGMDLQRELNRTGALLPVIMLARDADVPTVVEAMRGHVFDFLEQPVSADVLHERVCVALERDAKNRETRRQRENIRRRIELLSKREREVVELLLQARNAKQIAATLGIDVKTVARHRSRGMRKLGTRNEVELAQLASFLESDSQSLGRREPPTSRH